MFKENNDIETHSHSSWLYIRFKNDLSYPDIGDRPLPPGTVYYSSPDIFTSPHDHNGNIQSGIPVTLTARIINGGGVAAINVYVEFWWFNPTMAFSVNLTNQRIGTKIVNVPANNYVDVECPVKWIPGFVNGGHECLVVQCSSPSEGSDDLKFPFSAALDRHVAQQNLMVLQGTPVQQLKLTVSNPFRTAENFTVRLRTILIKGKMNDFTANNFRELIIHMAGMVPGQNLMYIYDHKLQQDVIDVTQHEFGIRITKTRKIKLFHKNNSDYALQIHYKGEQVEQYIQNRAILNPDFDPEMLGRVLTEVVLEPSAVIELDIELPALNVKTDNFLVHYFTQDVSGCDVGGYAIIIPPRG